MISDICKMQIDENGRELVQHGDSTFPIGCYHDDLSREEVPWHWHEEVEVAVISEGHAVIAASNEKYIVHQGEGVFINSGVLHGAWDVDRSSCRIHSLVFHPRLVGGSMDSVFYQKYVQPLLDHRGMESIYLTTNLSWQKKVVDAIERAWQKCAEGTGGYEFAVREALSELIFEIWKQMPKLQKKENLKSIRNEERIKSMLQYVHSHFAEEITVNQVADSASVSESECLRCFRNTIGVTPIQYVKQYRIQKASQLLMTSHEKIAAIGIQCGFQDASYFIKTFREMKGCSPTQFRQKKS